MEPMEPNSRDEPPTARDERLLDDAAVAALEADVGEHRLVPVMASFAEELARRMPALQSALDAGDVATVGRETHSIKGSALTFGALALGAAARRSNDASRTGDAATALGAAREVVELMPRTRDVVLRLVASRTEVQRQ